MVADVVSANAMQTALESCRSSLETSARVAWQNRDIGVLAFRRVMRITDPTVWNRLDRRSGLTTGQSVGHFLIEQGAERELNSADAPFTAINWDAILAFLKEFIPILEGLIQFIMSLFLGGL